MLVEPPRVVEPMLTRAQPEHMLLLWMLLGHWGPLLSFYSKKIESYCGKVFRDIYVVLRNSGKYLDTGLKSCIYLDSWRVLGILIIREHSNHIQYWTKIYICKKNIHSRHTLHHLIEKVWQKSQLVCLKQRPMQYLLAECPSNLWQKWPVHLAFLRHIWWKDTQWSTLWYIILSA